MPSLVKTKSKFKAGMYLLETLSSGMYNDPLIIYREYIQNAVDSIDQVDRQKLLSVKIDLDPTNKKITFKDNGIGIPADDAPDVLSAIGSSNKINQGMRGFRGIGRLGGLAFCEKATFRTKAYNETIESVQEWDCTKLRQMLSNNNNSSGTLKKLFDSSTKFYQMNSKKPRYSYFKVELEGVSSFRNYIFDFKRVHDYLANIAPVPYNPDEFSHGKLISRYLNKNIDNYSTYNIYLNGYKIYKPYKDKVKVTKKGHDQIGEIEFFDIKMESEPLAYGWVGKRKELLGAIVKGEKSSGIRVRSGNILIGDERLLDECFREVRFNSYYIGEIHICSPSLIPNSRRDDFIDNDQKTYFYNAIARKIGFRLSKDVRETSRNSSIAKNNTKPNPPLKVHTKSDKISILELRRHLEAECYNCQKLNKVLKSLIE